MLQQVYEMLLAALWWIGGVVAGAGDLIFGRPEEFGQQLVVQTVLNVITALIVWYFINRVLNRREAKRQRQEFFTVLRMLWAKFGETHFAVFEALTSAGDMVRMRYRTRLKRIQSLLLGIENELRNYITTYNELFHQVGLYEPVKRYQASLGQVIAAIRTLADAGERDAIHAASDATTFAAAGFPRFAIEQLEVALRNMNEALAALAAKLPEPDAATLKQALWGEREFDEIRAELLSPLFERA